jgi:NO-binding membrane sensor protein with MHYT domain
VVVFVGLFAVGNRRPTLPRILIGGVFTGVGVSGMHYTGMAAIRIAGDLTYRANLVLASVLIAVVAAIVALWLSVVVRGRAQVLIASGVMAVAVCAMHYTAMAAVGVRLDEDVYGTVHGVTPISLELPITLVAAVVLVVLAFVALQTVSREESSLPLMPPGVPSPALHAFDGTLRAVPRATGRDGLHHR